MGAQVEDFHISLLFSVSASLLLLTFMLQGGFCSWSFLGNLQSNSLTSYSFLCVRGLRCDFLPLCISFHHVSFCFVFLYFWVILVSVSLTMEFLFLLFVLLGFMSLSRENTGWEISLLNILRLKITLLWSLLSWPSIAIILYLVWANILLRLYLCSFIDYIYHDSLPIPVLLLIYVTGNLSFLKFTST